MGLLHRHDEIVEQALALFDGRIVKHTGDGTIGLKGFPDPVPLCEIVWAT